MKSAEMMIADALKMIKKKSADYDNILSDQEMLIVLSEAIENDISYIIGNKETSLTKKQESRLFEIINDLMVFSKPIEKITGKSFFYGLELFVNEHTLSPRQDTEVLVDKVISYVKTMGSDDARILDIGTGSACMAVAAALELDKCKITAVDISDEALKAADRNIKKYQLCDRIILQKSDLFDKICDKRFDIIMTNPPYINECDYYKLDKKVKEHDPAIALKGGEDGLLIIRRIIVHAHEYLYKNGVIFMEIGHDQADRVRDLMKDRYTDITVHKDYGDNDRVVYGKLRNTGDNT